MQNSYTFDQIERNEPASVARRLTDRTTAALRRLLDIVASFIGLLVLMPVWVWIAVMIRRDSEGPIFYGGPRVGRNGVPFKIWKFRTMYERKASYEGSRVTGRHDSRITPVGQWLRDTKLNELPQLWNVLIGEMSLVGPRPEDPEFVKRWSEKEAQAILSVRPGITSPASIIYRDEESMLQAESIVDEYVDSIMPSKLRLDMLYVRHRTLLSDLDVILWTLVTLLPRLRDKKISETHLMWGPVSKFISRYFSWWVLDSMSAFVAVGVAGVLWRRNAPLKLGVPEALVVALIVAIVFSLVNYAMRLHRVSWSRAQARRGTDLLLSTSIATGVLLLINSLWRPAPLLPANMLLMAGVLAFCGFIVVRFRMRLITSFAARWTRWRGTRESLGERVLVIGAGSMGEDAVWLMQKHLYGGAFSVVGFVDDAPQNLGLEIQGIPVLGGVSDLQTLVQQYDIGMLAFAIRNVSDEERERILDVCRQTKLPLVMVPNIIDLMYTQLPFNSNAIAASASSTNDLELRLMEIEMLLNENNVAEAHAKVRAAQALVKSTVSVHA